MPLHTSCHPISSLFTLDLAPSVGDQVVAAIGAASEINAAPNFSTLGSAAISPSGRRAHAVLLSKQYAVATKEPLLAGALDLLSLLLFLFGLFITILLVNCVDFPAVNY